MTVQEFADKLNLKILTGDELEREIKDCYIGDLLSWVMGRAPSDSAWLTVMGNINSIAVATLADVSCIVLVENAPLDANAKQKAEIHGVNILSTAENSYSIAKKLSALIGPRYEVFLRPTPSFLSFALRRRRYDSEQYHGYGKAFGAGRYRSDRPQFLSKL